MRDPLDKRLEAATQFFVMVRGQRGHALPLTDEEGDPVLFSAREDAEKAGKANVLGEHFGYEVYEW